MEVNGREWKRMEANGRDWKRMVGNGKKWNEMEENGREWRETEGYEWNDRKWKTKNQKTLVGGVLIKQKVDE